MCNTTCRDIGGAVRQGLGAVVLLLSPTAERGSRGPAGQDHALGLLEGHWVAGTGVLVDGPGEGAGCEEDHGVLQRKSPHWEQDQVEDERV